MITERWYPADAAFTIAVTGPDDTAALAAHALTEPLFAPYLGRRSCPPDTPLLLRTPSSCGGPAPGSACSTSSGRTARATRSSEP